MQFTTLGAKYVLFQDGHVYNVLTYEYMPPEIYDPNTPNNPGLWSYWNGSSCVKAYPPTNL